MKKKFKIKQPFLAVDCIINYKNKLLLIERKNYPFGWALVGGFVEYGETTEQAIKREVKEEVGLRLKNLKLFNVYSHPKRDPRGHCVSIVYTALGVGKIKVSSDAKNYGLFELTKLPSKMAFDHKKILNDYLKSLKK
uniref:NUDIX hydrolase n=1 Tax=candidate division WOR-3 bacterium TaxID=2052148 RepID=A0A7V3ZUB4_UNCW3